MTPKLSEHKSNYGERLQLHIGTGLSDALKQIGIGGFLGNLTPTLTAIVRTPNQSLVTNRTRSNEPITLLLLAFLGFPHSSRSLRSTAFRVQYVETIINRVQQCFLKTIES